MAKPSQVVEQLQEKSTKQRILDLALSGTQPAEIARQVDVDRTYVGRVLSEALSDTSEVLLEVADRLAKINLMRMERLIQATMPMALGEQKMAGSDETYPVDLNAVKVVASLIKQEMDWDKQLKEARARNPEMRGDELTNTIVSHDSLYSVAQLNMENEWLGGYADMGVDDLLPASVSDDDINLVKPDKHIRELEQKVDKLLGEKDEDDDSDDSDD